MRRLRFVVVLLVLACGASLAQAPYSIKLTLSNQADCTGAPALSLGTAATRSITVGGGGRNLVGSINISDIFVTKAIDACSIALYREMFLGQSVKTVTISVYLGATEVIRFTLGDAFVTGISDSEASGTAPTEKATFGFQTIEILDVATNTHVGYDTSAGRILP